MSLETKGQTCAVCHSYLFEEDDVVYCPTCGAPHHRDCYNSIGHCGYESLHGTDEQFDLKKRLEEKRQNTEENKDAAENTQICPFCMHKTEEKTRVCPYCGRPRIAGNFTEADFLGGVPKDYDIGAGVTADMAKELVGVNTQRYIPKFAKMTPKNKLSWNWMAFLFPQGWFLSRKMYAIGSIMIAVLAAAVICTLPINQFLQTELPITETTQQTYTALLEALPQMDMPLLVLAGIYSVVTLLVRVVSAVFGDYWYKAYVIRKVKERGQSDLDQQDYNHKYGGVNIILFALGLMLLNYLPTILSTLLV